MKYLLAFAVIQSRRKKYNFKIGKKETTPLSCDAQFTDYENKEAAEKHERR